MDLPSSLFPSAFSRLQKTASKAAKEEAMSSMVNAIKEEKDISAQMKIEISDTDSEMDMDTSDVGTELNNIRNLKVKGDGTWQKRGFSSLNGVATIIGAETEKVVDQEVLSAHCKMCQLWQKKNELPVGEKWEEWYNVHKLICTKNYYGTFGGMESTGMVRIFRTVEQYNAQYTEYVGDGDAKTFFNIVKAKPYGDTEIKKLECIGHVGKRFGYSMRRLKKEMKGRKLSDGKGLFGKGRLTDKIINSMQLYYTGAIRMNSKS